MSVNRSQPRSLPVSPPTYFHGDNHCKDLGAIYPGICHSTEMEQRLVAKRICRAHGLETVPRRGRDLVPPRGTSTFFSAFLLRSIPHNLACAARSLITSSTQSVSAALRVLSSCNLCSSSGGRSAEEVRSPERQRRSCWIDSGRRMLRQYCQQNSNQ